MTEGRTALAFSEDVARRFEAYGWHTRRIDGHDQERVAQAIEEAQAERERIAADISTKLWASTDIHTILQTAIQELSQRLGAAEGTIQPQR